MLRIIGGALRGRVLRAPGGRLTRPTSARVREAIFDVIAHHPTHGLDLDGARVGDLFAGSGALGIEALSRGAQEALFVEKDRRVVDLLRRNLTELGLADRSEILTLDVAKAQSALSARAPFDVLLLDPPYGIPQGVLRVLEALAPQGLLGQAGLLVLETAAGHDALALEGFGPPLLKRWGDTAAQFFTRLAGEPCQKGDCLE